MRAHPGRQDAPRPVRHTRMVIALGGVVLALGAAACGGSQAKVGDCIDAQKQVVGCGSPNAEMKLVSDQSGPRAIACVEIGKPQISVKVGGRTFCAESVSASK